MDNIAHPHYKHTILLPLRALLAHSSFFLQMPGRFTMVCIISRLAVCESERVLRAVGSLEATDYLLGRTLTPPLLMSCVLALYHLLWQCRNVEALT